MMKTNITINECPRHDGNQTVYFKKKREFASITHHTVGPLASV